MLLSLVISALLACINIGSTAALNAINSLGGVSIISSYYVPVACLAVKRLRGEPLPPRRWSLGRYGLAINLAALIFLTPFWFFYFWPIAKPVTAQTLNWAPVMYGGMIIVSATYRPGRADEEKSLEQGRPCAIWRRLVNIRWTAVLDPRVNTP